MYLTLSSKEKQNYGQLMRQPYFAGGGEKGGRGGSCHEVTIVNFRFHESRNKKFTGVKFVKDTEKI